MPRSRKVYPVPGYYLTLVPSVPHDCDETGDHHLCLASGAFTIKRPPDEAEATDEGPADAGSLDSED